jgi:hypothetical protein
MGRPRTKHPEYIPPERATEIQVGPRQKEKIPSRQADLRKEEQEGRAGLMMARRLTGHYLTEIAKEFQASTEEVKESLQEARRKALHTKALDFITNQLMPKALAVYAAALDGGDVEVATKVLEGLGVLGAKGQVNLLMGGGDGSAETFESWRLRVTRNVTGDPGSGLTALPAGDQSLLAEGVVCRSHQGSPVDAEILEASHREAAGEGGVA